MCGRFNQHNISYGGPDGRFEAKLTRINRKNAANISAGMHAVILTNEGYQEAEFGFRPSWDPKKLFINATIEGKAEPGNIGIDKMPTFAKAYKERRCILPVNSFIEGPEKEKLSRPFNIVPASGLLFLAAIKNTYTKTSGETEDCFAILTQPAIPICAAIGHHRSPVMLYEDIFEMWLDSSTPLDELSSFLKMGYYNLDLKAEPLDPNLIKSGKLHEEEILIPIGDAIYV